MLLNDSVFFYRSACVIEDALTQWFPNLFEPLPKSR